MQTADDMYALAYDSDVCNPNTAQGQASRGWYEARADVLDAVVWLQEHEDCSVASVILVNMFVERLDRAVARLRAAGATLDAAED